MTPAGDDSLASFEALFASHGGTANEYLRVHYARFVATKHEFLRGWDRRRGNRVLDLGAHWLHQSMLYAIDGFEVVAVDLPITFELDNVRSLAEAHAIELIPEADFERSDALRRIPENSIDIVLFTEIIEHITFNPVAMWREIHRVMKPGARVIVTTPNYYARRGRAWDWRRFLSGFGGGLPVLEILGTHTHGHHWKEFTLRELIYYFCALSPDFICTKALQLPDFASIDGARMNGHFGRGIEKLIPKLRPNLHVEIELRDKSRGIVIEPRW